LATDSENGVMSGMVIAEDDDYFKQLPSQDFFPCVGYYSDNWVETSFVDYHGTITLEND